VTLGKALLRVVPLRRVQQISAVALLILAAYSVVSALT
jgi:putative Ca2+/H+ antiporter (TMEM165/GDT1 family)